MRQMLVAVVLVGAACHPALPVTTRLYKAEQAQPPHTAVRGDGTMLMTIEGAAGNHVVALPSGDLIVIGWAEQPFVMRMSASGVVKWTVPFDRCQGFLLAAAGDDAIYVVDRAEGSATKKSTHCDSAKSSDHAVLYKLDGKGAIVWRIAAPFSPRWLAASADRVVVGGDGELAITAAGELAWTHADADLWTYGAALASDGSVVMSGSQRPASSAIPRADTPCVLRALDGATGETRWNQVIAPAASWCNDRGVVIRGAVAIAQSHDILDDGPGTYADFLTGFDTATGEQRWQRRFKLDGEPFAPVPPLGAPSAPDDPVVLSYQLTHQNITVLVVNAIDPSSGAVVPIGVVSADLPMSGVRDLVSISEVRLDAGFVVAIGRFTGRLSVARLTARSPHGLGTACHPVDSDLDYAGPDCWPTDEWRPMMFVARFLVNRPSGQ